MNKNNFGGFVLPLAGAPVSSRHSTAASRLCARMDEAVTRGLV